MSLTALIIVLGKGLITALGQKSVEKASEGMLTPLVAGAKDKLLQKLKKGQYEAIQRALHGARADVLNQCQTDEQRDVIEKALDELMQSPSGTLLDEFGKRVAQTYLLPEVEPSVSPDLVVLYRKARGPTAIIWGDVLDEAQLTRLFQAFFSAFRERLMREPDFTFLREFVQLTEDRRQTALQQAMVDLLQTTQEHLAAIAANTAHPVENSAATDRAYREALVERLKEHTIRGFAPQTSSGIVSLLLKDIFLPLEAVEGRPALAKYAEEDVRQQLEREIVNELDWQRYRDEIERRRARLSAQQATQRPLSLSDLLKHQRVVLLGDPGSGKTTVTEYLAYALAAGDYQYVGMGLRGRIPILVRIANYATAYKRDATLNFFEYITRELEQKPEIGRYLEQELRYGRCLVILDGLDEVTDPGLRQKVTDQIKDLVANFHDNHYLITSRIIGYDVSPLTSEYQHATLKDLTDIEQARFIRLWYGAITSRTGAAKQYNDADKLIEALRAKPQIARIAANPLLLTIIVLMHWRGAKLPNQRVQVYQNATDTLIEYWTSQRYVDLPADEVKHILAPIAHTILSSGVGGVIARHMMLPLFHEGIAREHGCDAATAQRLGRDMLRNLNEQSGLFLERGLDTNNQPLYGFLHQTFGEYLAGLYLAEELLSGRFHLDTYIHRSVWYEPLLLAAGHLSTFSPTHTDSLIHDILNFPAAYEDVLRRNVLLASDCLADDVRISPSLRDTVLDALADLLQSETPQLYTAALERYQALAATRHKEAARLAIQRTYHLDHSDSLHSLNDRTKLNLATALVHLNAQADAWPIVRQMEARPYVSGLNYQLQRLRFIGWPEQAIDYLLQLQTKQDSRFSVSAEITLTDSIIGPVDSALARRVLGEAGFRTLLNALLDRSTDRATQWTLRWISTLITEPPQLEQLLDLTVENAPAKIRRMAANRLLDSSYHAEAIETLCNLVAHNPQEAPDAAQTLLVAGEKADLDWRLLYDIALLADDQQAPKAIITLLRAGDMAIGLPAALHVLATRLPDDQIWTVVEGLMAHGYTKVGRAAAAWLSLRPGYRDRMRACDALREAGAIDQAIQSLMLIARECPNGDGWNACRQLIGLGEAECVVPILAWAAQSGRPEARYQACLALALSGRAAASNSATPSTSALDMAFIQARVQTYQDAVNMFGSVGIQALDTLTPTDDYSIAAQNLARLDLQTLITPTGISTELEDSLQHSSWPAIHLNLVLHDLRTGYIEAAKQQLLTWLDNGNELLSSPILLQTLDACQVISETHLLEIGSKLLAFEDSAVRQAAAFALGQLGALAAIPPLIVLLADPESNVRQAAASVFGWLDAPLAIPPLSTLLADPESDVRRAAAFALGWLGDPAAIPPLSTLLADLESDVRPAAAFALGQLGDPAAIPPLSTLLADPESNVRQVAASALGQLGTPAAIPPLSTLLADPESDVRQAAASALGQLGDPAAIPPLSTLLADPESDVRQVAASALGRLGDPAAIPPLIALLADPESDVRQAATSALGQLGDPAAIPPLIALLADLESDVRQAAASALGQLGDPAAIPPLIVLLVDSKSDMRQAAASTLGWLGAPATIPPLIALLADPESNVRQAAASALGQLGAPAAIPPLIALLADPESDVRQVAASALGRLNDPAAIPLLIVGLNDKAWNVRQNVVKALGRIGNPTIAPHLVPMLFDIDNDVRAAAALSLARQGTRDILPLLIATSVGALSQRNATQYVHAVALLDPLSALKLLDQYERRFQRNGWAERIRGHILWQHGDTENALVALQQSLSKKRNVETLLALAHYTLEQSDLQLANEYIRQALFLEPRNALVRLSRAIMLQQQGEITRAYTLLSQVKRNDQDIVDADALRYEHFWGSKAIATLGTLLKLGKVIVSKD